MVQSAEVQWCRCADKVNRGRGVQVTGTEVQRRGGAEVRLGIE